MDNVGRVYHRLGSMSGCGCHFRLFFHETVVPVVVADADSFRP